jgi:hypothetical protein
MTTQFGDSAEIIKKKIRRIVANYKLLNPEDYKLTRKAVDMKRKLLQDPRFGTGENIDMRALFEISETLSTSLIRGLDTEASNWFKSKEGGRWFARTYGEFSLAEFV